MEGQPAIKAVLDVLHRERALEKISPLVNTLSQQNEVAYKQLKFQKMEKC